MSFARYCIPLSARGAGLGNLLVPWARAFLAAQLLGARCLPPAFGLNRRDYYRHFETPRHDWMIHRLLLAGLPTFEFDEAAYLSHGGGDAVDALRSFAREHDLFARRAYVLCTSGMWGGMLHIEAARDFVLSTLYRSRYAPANLLRVRDRLDRNRPIVGLHVRMGDFEAALAPGAYRGRFNVSLPLEWYGRVMSSIRAQLAGAVQFLIVSDAAPKDLESLQVGADCVWTSDIADSDCSDLLALARCDLIVCSVSTYSIWAAFLSDAPYLWYGPNLHLHPEGLLSIWGHEAGQQAQTSPTRRAVAALQSDACLQTRAWAVDVDGRVPSAALGQMPCFRRCAAGDLIRYGVVRPAGAAE